MIFRSNNLVFLVSLCTAVLVSPPCLAATITVTNTNDSGAGSLRQAIIGAAFGDTILFSVTGVITLTAGELAIAKALTITGPGAADLAIDGNNSSRVFNITAGSVNISGLTLQNGASSSWGGCIANEGTLQITDCVVAACAANGFGNGYGGGLDNYNGTVTITRSTISGNTATNEGGGLRTENGSIALTDCTLSGNTSDNGGGIVNRGGTVVLNRSTVYNNHASSGGNRYGGGILSDGGTLTLTNSTISGNGAVNGGGGIIDGAAVNMSISHCTITGNTSTNGGGGIDLQSTAANIQNTILAGNTGGGGNNFNNGGAGSLVSGGYNLSNDAVAAFTATGDQQNATAGLDSIADNGGESHTHALHASSGAIEAIPKGSNGCTAGVSEDQRAYPRADGSGFGGAACDVGSFEYNTIPVELMSFTID